MFFNFRKYLWLLVNVTILSGSNLVAQVQDEVNGNLIQFNDNGLWCWFQDERAIIDKSSGKLILGSDASQAGVGYSARDGAIEAVIYDLNTGLSGRYELADMGCDDHNVPGFILRPDGKYLSMYSEHYDYYNSRYRIFDGSEWSPEQVFDWMARPGGTNYTIAYNNLYYLSEEERMYNFSRAVNRSPNFIVSDDMGDTWSFGGQLTTNTSNSYNKGYYKYWSNGVNRIDFIFTEQHPRDTLTSIYHGYLQDGRAYNSNGIIVDDNIYDSTFVPAFWNFTRVFGDNTIIGNIAFRRCWQSDLVRYDDGTISAIITARTNQSYSPGYPDNNINPEHEFVYCRFDGSNWSYSYLGKAGLKFYASEADYVGLGALVPDDPNTLYISTPYDPRDTTINLGVREIFKGVTSNNGETWEWTPVTQNSVRDNIRPIVPAWENNKTALLWCRGTYISAQGFDAAVVGIIENNSEISGEKNYIDASESNTNYVNGSTITATGPDENPGTSDNQWHERTGIGNGGNIYTSAELTDGENAPMIKTHINLPDGGTYDVWVNFWGHPNVYSEWRIKAGLSPENMQLFRSMACKQVEGTDYESEPVLSSNSESYLYQAYIGRVNDVRSFDVFVDDSAYNIGTPQPIIAGDINRTWYDGVSYAAVTEIPVSVNGDQNIPSEFTLKQNYPNPFNPSTTISYLLNKPSTVKLTVYNMLGQKIKVLLDGFRNAGGHSIMWDATDDSSIPVTSGVYFYQLKTDKQVLQKKMVLVR
ncbi:MAG: T9SS type A sorting domain-containing protein [Ignavibacteriaceae bacterium]